MKTFLITYEAIGDDAGPFTIKDSTGATVATGITRAQLLAGYTVTVADTANAVTISSSGTCTDTIELEKPPVIGYLNYPGTTHIDSWVNNNQYIATNRTPTAAATIGALDGYTIIEGGVIGGTQQLAVAGPATSLGEFNGGGTVIMTANNTISGLTTVQTGAVLQLGLNLDSDTGRVAAVTVQFGAELDVVGANTANFTKTGALTNGGTTNWTGPGVCGLGIMQVGGAVANTGTINIDDSYFRAATGGISGTGTINVLDGGTLGTNSLPIAATQTVNINGCGFCAANGVPQGAILLEGTGVTYAARVNVITEACIKTSGTANTTMSGLLTGSAPLTIGTIGTAVPSAITAITNSNNTYNGVLTIDSTTLNQSGATNALQYADIRLENSGRLSNGSGTGINIASIGGTDAAAYYVGSLNNNLYIKDNGETTFAGRFLGSSSVETNVYLEGGAANVLTLTTAGHTANLIARNGSKVVLEGGTFTAAGQIDLLNGSTVSAGTSTTGATTLLNMDATSILEVRATSATSVGLLTTTTFNATAGTFVVDLPDTLQAGTYPILRANTGTGIPDIPTTGVNNTGLTPTYSWNTTVTPRVLSVTLA